MYHTTFLNSSKTLKEVLYFTHYQVYNGAGTSGIYPIGACFVVLIRNYIPLSGGCSDDMGVTGGVGATMRGGAPGIGCDCVEAI